MKKLSIIPVLAFVYLSAATAAFAQSDNKETKPAESTIAGKWKLTVEVESPDNTSTVEIKLDGKKVTGSAKALSGEFPFEGEFAEGKLSFVMDYLGIKLTFTGTLQEDGRLAGSLDHPQGPFKWKAERIKEK